MVDEKDDVTSNINISFERKSNSSHSSSDEDDESDLSYEDLATRSFSNILNENENSKL